MRPREQSNGQDDLFLSRLDQIIDPRHELVRRGGLVDWRVIGAKFGEVYSDGPGQPPLPTRLMAGLAILEHTFNLSDEDLVARWVENPYFQHFCGEEHCRHKAPFDRSSMTRWRQRMGEERHEVLEPLAKSVDLHPVQFAIVSIVSLAFGLVTPPYGLCLMIACSVAGVRLRYALKDTMIMLVPMLLVLAALIIWPDLCLFLPRLLVPEMLR
jgi:Transposase domain (DUF772)/Tripartite ATP-independent periplasmic transporter, DctM component